MERRETLEKQRKQWVERAEKKFGMREGVYRYIDDGETKWVKLTVEFYPKEHWLITDVRTLSITELVDGTTRPLPASLKNSLTSILK